MNINISETLLNALEKRKKGAPLKIAPEDFSVHRVEFSTASETALLIDVSYSMLMNDALTPARKSRWLCIDSLRPNTRRIPCTWSPSGPTPS